ncbi:hypothetical protein GIB67_019125 [Kingdonia uniflora]|uniref:FAD-binding PCMH-type domain-containing protein n=1 Tax=Kingdonia uniflora TaxID=39325 RepID=A0A7J7MZQ3_9MAGN|nr:hypothetical protein GIB67_019125 [Kingdonia uniflora]
MKLADIPFALVKAAIKLVPIEPRTNEDIQAFEYSFRNLIVSLGSDVKSVVEVSHMLKGLILRIDDGKDKMSAVIIDKLEQESAAKINEVSAARDNLALRLEEDGYSKADIMVMVKGRSTDVVGFVEEDDEEVAAPTPICETVFRLVILALNLNRLHGNISINPSDIKRISLDFGNMRHVESLAVLYPNLAHDIVELVKMSYQSEKEREEPIQGLMGSYVDIWGGDLWVNVLNWTTTYGLAPKSWTNYLYVIVGGTLSNAGVGGQSFIHGPQISNVYELDIVTGKGELKTCSKEENSELFYEVLGGLGQFGIITRARIALEPAPESMVLIHLTYIDFSKFTKDIEYLISLHEKPMSERFDCVLGLVFLDQGGVIYVLEVVKYFDKSIKDIIRQDVSELRLIVENLMKDLAKEKN